MKQISSISRYNSAYEILEEFCSPEFWDEIDEDDNIFLQHFDDFEGFTYYCINGEVILAAITDEVIYQCNSFEEFLRQVEDLLASDREDR